MNTGFSDTELGSLLAVSMLLGLNTSTQISQSAEPLGRLAGLFRVFGCWLVLFLVCAEIRPRASHTPD